MSLSVRCRWTTVLIVVLVLLLRVSMTTPMNTWSIHLKDDGRRPHDRLYEYELEVPHEETSWSFSPSSVFNLSAVTAEIFVSADDTSTDCANHTRQLFDDFRRLRPWALKMLDASAKIPSQVLSGNLDWWGSTSECFQVRVPSSSSPSDDDGRATGQALGQYCSVSLRLSASTTDTSNDVRELLDALMQNVPRRAPRQIPDLVVGLCVPSSCSPTEVKANVENAFRHVLIPKTISMVVDVRSCQTKDSVRLDTVAIVVLAILCLFALVIVIATVYEAADLVATMQSSHKMDNEGSAGSMDVITSTTNILQYRTQEKQGGHAKAALLCFSALKNSKQLLTVSSNRTGNLGMLEGLRFLSMIWIVMVHSYSLALNSSSLWDNMGDMLNLTRLILFQAIIEGAMGVNTFLFISGLLLVYTGMKKVQATDKGIGSSLRCLGHLYLHRIIRTAPAYFMIVAWVAGPSDYIVDGGGPLWSQIVRAKLDCQMTWWKSLLYISNFGDTSHMCAPHTWYIAMDMQFFILGCILLVVLSRHRKSGLLLISMAGLGSCITAGVISKVKSLSSSSLLLTVPEAQLVAYSTDFYIKPYCRMGPYAVGMLVGYLMLSGSSGDSQKRIIRPVVACVLWVVAVIVTLFVVYGSYGQFLSEETPDALQGIFFNSLAGTAWSLGIAWMVYAGHIGYGGIVKTFLSLDVWVPLGRLTYGAFLVHYVVIYTFYESRRDEKLHCDLFLMLILLLGFVMLSYGAAFLLALAFESPFIGLERLLMTGAASGKMQNHVRSTKTLKA